MSIREILEELISNYIDDKENCINQAHQAILAEFERILPEKEKEENLCHCEFDGNPYLDEKENLIKCKGCNKQIGHKLWNACLDTIKAKLHSELTL